MKKITKNILNHGKRTGLRNKSACIICSSFVFLVFIIPQILHAQQTEKLYLSGTGNDNTVNWEFFCTGGMNANKWTTIPVPSCWELQGFGKYDYGFAKDSIRGKEKGLYKYKFTVPKSWRNKLVSIVFEGSMTDTEVKINGHSAGRTHQGAFYSFSYNVTDLLLTEGENLLEVTVSKHSANQSVNAAERRGDFWIFGGIFRPVYLEAFPDDHIERVAIDAKATGEFNAEIFTIGQADKVSVQLYTSKGIKYGAPIIGKINYKNISEVSAKFNSPALWNPESPNLYKAIFTLYKKEKIVHQFSQRFGFRTVEVKERDGVYVNGVKVKMKGVNRHSFWPTSGRTTSKRLSIEDVLLMKDMNMNAVRMSHYPPDDHFLDACDSLGLFVMDELAGWHGHYDTPTGTKLIREMIAHDVNHPSIIFWSNGNEGGHNLELDSLFDAYDPQQRTVVHPWQLFNGIETQHYREYNYGIGNYDHGHDIVMPTEFLHGLYDGGHGAGLEDYWEAMWKNPLSAGGFLWDFADEGVVRKDKNDSIDTDGNHGADGIIGPFHEKEGSYYAIKEIWSPVHIEPIQITGRRQVLNITNRFSFTNLNQCHFVWKIYSFSYNDTAVRLVRTAAVKSPDIKPGANGVLEVPLLIRGGNYVLYLTVTDKFGRELFTWHFHNDSPEWMFSHDYYLLTYGNNTPRVDTQGNNYVIKTSGIIYTIDKITGILKQVKNGEKEIPFNNGPVIQEGVNNFAGFSFHYNEDSSLVITSIFDRENSYNTLTWTIHGNGVLQMDVKYFPGAYFTDFAGVNFSFPEKEIKEIQYLGDGPYRVWKNRMKGTQFGIWNKPYNNTETGEQWVYPEFKGYYSNMYWCKFFTKDQSFKVMTTDEDIFLRLFTPAFKDDQWHNYQLLFPSGDISFMQAIPGIGTKTQRAETTGPMGMKNIFYDYEKDPQRAKTLTLYFDFTGNQ